MATQSASTAQLFLVTPMILQNALGITSDEIRTYCLEAWQPAGYDGDANEILTVFLGFIPNSVVDALAVSAFLFIHDCDWC